MSNRILNTNSQIHILQCDKQIIFCLIIGLEIIKKIIMLFICSKNQQQPQITM